MDLYSIQLYFDSIGRKTWYGFLVKASSEKRAVFKVLRQFIEMYGYTDENALKAFSKRVWEKRTLGEDTEVVYDLKLRLLYMRVGDVESYDFNKGAVISTSEDFDSP